MDLSWGSGKPREDFRVGAWVAGFIDLAGPLKTCKKIRVDFKL